MSRYRRIPVLEGQLGPIRPDAWPAFCIMDPDAEDEPSWNAPFYSSRPDWAAITTGYLEGGKKPSITVQTSLRDPGQDSGAWNEVHSDTLISRTGILMLCDSNAQPLAKDANFAFAGPGVYGIRIHARGRDTKGAPVDDWEAYKAAPVDFLIQLWSGGRPGQQPEQAPQVQGPFPVDVDEHQFYIASVGGDLDDGSGVVTRANREGECAAAVDDFVYVATGIACGNVTVTAHLAPSDPGRAGQEWEQASEFDVRSREGELFIQSIFGGGEDLPQDAYEINFAHAGPGLYRMRVHGRGRDANYDGVQEDDEPIVEHYLIQVWPLPATG